MAAKGSGNAVHGSKSMKTLPLSCLNHISRTCSNLSAAENFYENLLGFVQIKRPGFDFDGAWLFNYGIGIHLLQSDNGNVLAQEREIDPMSDHISFQCEDISMVEMKLQENNVKYVRRMVEEGGIIVDQIFFHDPDGFMIEVCNCDQLPVVPLGRSPSFINQQPVFGSCKRTNSHSTLIPISVADCASQNIMQSGNQVGNQDYAICG
ncbi:unnamed protein product [Calypogeia fissa]